jgi:hypothetical protein
VFDIQAVTANAALSAGSLNAAMVLDPALLGVLKQIGQMSSEIVPRSK